MLFNLLQDDITEILFHVFHPSFPYNIFLEYDNVSEDFLPFKLSQFSVSGLLSKLG